MIHFTLTLDCSRSALAISGYSTTVSGTQAAHATDRDGRPVVPSTALRGALRMSMEALLRATDRGACLGGQGDNGTAECRAAGGGRCLACQIFGGGRRGVAPGDRSFSALVLGDAMLDPEAPRPVVALRHSVAVARGTRSAQDDMLSNRLGPAPGQPLLFRAEGRLVSLESDPTESATGDAERWQMLAAAARATKHIGSGRSRGLGRVDIHLSRLDPTASAPAAGAADLPWLAGDLRLRLTLRSPASIGLAMARDDQRDTRFDIPGATLRGAVGFGLAEVLDRPDDDRDFQDLVREEDGAIFDFLYPVDPARQDAGAAGGLAAPYPRTVGACKHHPYNGPDKPGHGLYETLLDLLALEIACERDQALTGMAIGRCPRCEASLEPVSEMWRLQDTPVQTRFVTRVRLSRQLDAAEDGDLFTQVLIEPGQVFEGGVRAIPQQGRSHLLRALRELRLALGRGRSRGWGQVAVELLPPVELPALEDRARAFDQALSARFAELGLGPVAGRLVVLTLLSPWLLPAPPVQERDLLADALGWPREATTLVQRSRRFGHERGWAQRRSNTRDAGERSAHHSVLAGGVYVLRLDDRGPGTGPDWRHAVERLELQGIGERTRMGFGRVLAFDPFIADNFSRRQRDRAGHRGRP